MKRMLVTGGTVFVSRFIAEYLLSAGYDVYVLNRNSRGAVCGREADPGGPACAGGRPAPVCVRLSDAEKLAPEDELPCPF